MHHLYWAVGIPHKDFDWAPDVLPGRGDLAVRAEVLVACLVRGAKAPASLHLVVVFPDSALALDLACCPDSVAVWD